MDLNLDFKNLFKNFIGNPRVKRYSLLGARYSLWGLAALIFLAGLLTIYAGYQHSLPAGRLKIDPPPPYIGVAARLIALFSADFIIGMSEGARAAMRLQQSGLLIPLSILGVLLLLLSAPIGYCPKFISVPELPAEGDGLDHAPDSVHLEGHDEDEDGAPAAEDDIFGGVASAESMRLRNTISAATRYKTDFDEDLLELGGEDDHDFDEIDRVIGMTHAALDPEMCEKVLRAFRPDIFPQMEKFTKTAVEKFAKHILLHLILLDKRDQKDITPDQFRLQDNRVNEMERETIAKRFMPRHPENLTDEQREHVGRVYDTSEQPEMQQKTHSDVRDWVDVSLRSAAEVVSADPQDSAKTAKPAADKPAA